MNQFLRFFLVLLVACEMTSCVVADVDPVYSGWDGGAGVVVGSAAAGMVGRPYYGGYYRRPYAGAGYYGRSAARGYWRPYVGGRPGRF